MEDEEEMGVQSYQGGRRVCGQFKVCDKLPDP